MNKPVMTEEAEGPTITVGEFVALYAITKDNSWNSIRARGEDLEAAALADASLVRIVFDDQGSDLPSHVDITPLGWRLLR